MLTDEELQQKYEEFIKRQTTPSQDSIDLVHWAIETEIERGALIQVPDVRGWPEWAVEVAFYYCGKKGERQFVNKVHRPAPAWMPKTGDRYWAFYGNDPFPRFGIWGKAAPQHSHGDMFAAYTSDDEVDWSRDKFRARGNLLEDKS